MNQHMRGNVVVRYWNKVKEWGAANNWGNIPIQGIYYLEEGMKGIGIHRLWRNRL